MTPAEVKSVMRLLLSLCPAKVPPINRQFAAAWVEALAPYAEPDVRAAALSWARKKPYFPTVSDLTKNISPAVSGRNDLDLAYKLLEQRKQSS